jgi:type III pantothenate kinase
VDAGNTNIKICRVENDQIIEIDVFSDVEKGLLKLKNQDVVLVSVIKESLYVILTEHCRSVFLIDVKQHLPFSSSYESMETLGVDRLCNVAGMLKYAKNKSSLCIDIGTCVKFDFIDQGIDYKGGAISPGIRLRYKSLNDYTHKLPLLTELESVNIIGADTKKSIISGVMNGLKAEIIGVIERYEHEFGPIHVYLTGGDARYFDIPQKNNIFAVKNLTLEGAVEIYKLNAL